LERFKIKDLLKLAAAPGVGPNRIRSLVAYFKTPTAVLEASAHELAQVEGIDKKIALNIVKSEDSEQFVDQQLSKLNKVSARIVTFWDKEYPDNLKRIYDPPAFLFIRGEFTEKEKYSIAVVGTRNPTDYGKLVAERLSGEIAEQGIPIVSGLARGIDTIAHIAALKADQRTVAVIGSGVDVIYPPENKKLAEKIIESGVIVSEFDMGTKPDAVNFPRRNRIISGIALGTLIVETTIEGGAMITAQFALDQDREVFAVPGNITEKRSGGTNRLIKEGNAKLVQTVDDILCELEVKLRPIITKGRERTPEMNLTLFETKILDVLSDNPLHIDKIAELTGLSTSDALVQLLSLEFKSLVRQIAGKRFVRL
jgi:DNA processing protein